MVSSSTSFCAAGWSSDSILSSTENASSADSTLRNGSHNASVRQSPGRRPRRSSSRRPRSPPSSPLVYSILVEDKQVGRADYQVLICRVKQPKFFKAKYWFCKPGNSEANTDWEISTSCESDRLETRVYVAFYFLLNMTSTIRILCSRSVGLIWLFLFIFWCLVFLHFLWKNILFLDILGILCDVNIRNMISLLVVMLTSALASLLLSVLLFITTLMFSLVTAWGAEGRTFTDSSFMFSFFYWKHNFTYFFVFVCFRKFK